MSEEDVSLPLPTPPTAGRGFQRVQLPANVASSHVEIPIVYGLLASSPYQFAVLSDVMERLQRVPVLMNEPYHDAVFATSAYAGLLRNNIEMQAGLICMTRGLPRRAIQLIEAIVLYVPVDVLRGPGEFFDPTELVDPALLDPEPWRPGRKDRLQWHRIPFMSVTQLAEFYRQLADHTGLAFRPFAAPNAIAAPLPEPTGPPGIADIPIPATERPFLGETPIFADVAGDRSGPLIPRQERRQPEGGEQPMGGQPDPGTDDRDDTSGGQGNDAGDGDDDHH